MFVTGLTSQGTNQAGALPLPGLFNIVSGAASTGVILPARPSAGENVAIFIRNNGANAINVYPQVGGRVNAAAANAAFSLAPANSARFVQDILGNWWQF